MVLARSAEGSSVGRLRARRPGQLLDALIVGIRDVEVALGVQRDAQGGLELARVCAGSTPLHGGTAVRRELLNSVVIPFGDVDVPLPVDGETSRALKLSRLATGGSPLCQRLPRRGELLDAVVAG